MGTKLCVCVCVLLKGTLTVDRLAAVLHMAVGQLLQAGDEVLRHLQVAEPGHHLPTTATMLGISQVKPTRPFASVLYPTWLTAMAAYFCTLL